MTSQDGDYVSRKEFEDLKAKMEEARAVSSSTNVLVRELHSALMECQPGFKHSLLDRMATVTIQIESGDRVAHLVVKIGGVLAAIGAIYMAFKHGVSK